MRREDDRAANREAWDEAAPIHRERTFAELLARFRESGHSCLAPIETEVLRAIGMEGKAVAQLCRNNGRERPPKNPRGIGDEIFLHGPYPRPYLNRARGRERPAARTDRSWDRDR